jgi:very-short-patch-repair endonuclease
LKYGLPFRYVGDGSYWIGDLNPDFISTNDQKIVVEIFGLYWHSPLLNPKIDKRMTKEYREQYYRKRGWIPVIIWEDEVYDENRVLKIIKNVLKNKIILSES